MFLTLFFDGFSGDDKLFADFLAADSFENRLQNLNAGSLKINGTDTSIF